MMSDSDSSQSDDSDNWDECETDPQKFLCFFCEYVDESAENVFIHCNGIHKFDLPCYHHLHQMDCIQYIKLINYIRKEVR